MKEKEKEEEVTAIAFITTRSTCQEYIYAYICVCSTEQHLCMDVYLNEKKLLDSLG